MAGKPGCGGKKGRSGRKSKRSEYEKQKKREDNISLSEDIVKRALKSKKLEIGKKADLAVKIVTKDMGNSLTLKGDQDSPIIIEVVKFGGKRAKAEESNV